MTTSVPWRLGRGRPFSSPRTRASDTGFRQKTQTTRPRARLMKAAALIFLRQKRKEARRSRVTIKPGGRRKAASSFFSANIILTRVPSDASSRGSSSEEQRPRGFDDENPGQAEQE